MKPIFKAAIDAITELAESNERDVNLRIDVYALCYHLDKKYGKECREDIIAARAQQLTRPVDKRNVPLKVGDLIVTDDGESGTVTELQGTRVIFRHKGSGTLRVAFYDQVTKVVLP